MKKVNKAAQWVNRQLNDMSHSEFMWFGILVGIVGLSIGLSAAFLLPGWGLVILIGLCLLGAYACHLRLSEINRQR